MMVRRATPNDASTLAEMMAEFYAEANYPLDKEWAIDAFAALLGNEALGAAWLAFEADEPAGYVVLTTRFHMEYGAPGATVDDLYVSHRFRRRGHGDALLRALFDESRRRGARVVQVEAALDNVPAMALYHRFGLRDTHHALLTAPLATASGPEAEVNATTPPLPLG
jgi:ribosomal protein S18 acetylase RimI-like enzyme